MAIDVGRLEAATQELRATLKDGLITSDIWDRATGLSLSSYNSNPTAVALLTEMVNTLTHHLGEAGFPALNRYLLAELQDNQAVVVIPHGDELLQGFLVDTTKTNLGILLAVALPKMLSKVSVPSVTDPSWCRALTGEEPKVSALPTRLLLARLREEVARNPTRLDAAVAQLREFFTSNVFAMRDLARL